MKLKLTYQRSTGRTAADLLINVDGSATVGALARRLASSDPTGPPNGQTSSYTLSLVGPAHQPLDPNMRMTDSGILSGSTVQLVPVDGEQGGRPLHVAAVAVVTEGPDAGREFPLPPGSSVIGRDRSCDVRLSDPLVSRQHARINVTDVVELIDLGSSNGLVIGDEVSERILLRPSDTVRLGDTGLSVRLLGGTAHYTSFAVPFNRPPQVERRFAGVELAAPEPPDRPQSQRFPILPLFAPLILGLVLYITTHSLASLVFVGMSPLLVVANAAEGRLAGRKSYKASLEQFRTDIAGLVADAARAQEEERSRRLEEHPSGAEAIEAAVRLSPRLWCRWPDLPGFAELRLGMGTQPSRNKIRFPGGKENNRALWQELREAVAPFAAVDGVPVVASLAEDGSIGVAGPRELALGVARSLVVQLACLHSPNELALVALASSDSSRAWEWVKWLPHCNPGDGGITQSPMASTAPACAGLLAELRQLVTERTTAMADKRYDANLPAVVVLIENDAPVARSTAVDLARNGPAAGVHIIWVSPDVGTLPAACRLFVDAQPDPGVSAAGSVHREEYVAPLRLEPLSETECVGVARRLSALLDATAGTDDQTDLPRSVSLLSLVGREMATNADAVIERWNESGSILTGPLKTDAVSPRRGRAASLRAIVGETASGPHILDLRSHGPHALVGGTTGSGKSELLQSWILGMALTNSPQRVTFLLVDYKGGSAFSECLHLPHTVGLVTDLSPHLVRRALTSLSAELKFREDLLRRRRAKDLVELERTGDPEAPPSLVIVVDEFAALVQEVPDFVDGVVNVAQRGRSLGLHLILATQRPAGVIKDNLRANTNLRMALRVADEADSTDVLGSAEAASFDPAIPGRAVSRTGPSQLVPFQAGYAGGWTSEKPPAPAIDITPLGFGPASGWEAPAETVDHEESGPTDIQRVVANVKTASARAEIPASRLPWLPELAHVYDLTRLPTRRTDDELVFAVADDPERQAQPVVSFNPDLDGNLAVYGTGNSGKSTLLRTIAVAAGFTVRGGPCHVYGLDFGSRGLAMLEDLPHVGAIVPGGDEERVGRLIGMLRSTIDERASRYSAVGAATITSYRKLAGNAEEPRILVLVDGMGAFRSAYEGTEHARLFESFIGAAADGRPVGVHFLVSADRPGALPVALSASVQRRIALRLADPNDYATIGMPTDILDDASPPGRGIFGEQEIQVAVIGKSADTAVQARELQKLGRTMLDVGVARAPAVRRLVDHIAISDLPKELDGRPVIGISGASLEPVGFEPRGTFTVAGPPGSGRTTTLMTVISSLKRWRPETTLVYIGNRRSPLASAFEWECSALDADAAATLAMDLPGRMGEATEGMAPWVVVIEGLPDFLNGPADFQLGEMAKKVVASGHMLVTEGEAMALAGSYPLLVASRASRVGIALQPEPSDSVLFRTVFPRIRRMDFPSGRGLMAARGGLPFVVQVAVP